jgi:hypothetical protein
VKLGHFWFVPFWHLTNYGWLPEYFGKVLRWGDETTRNRVVIVPFVGEFIWWDAEPCTDPTCDCRRDVNP